MTQLMTRGSSWSGRERNCCFLNMGDGTFVDASAISGLDFVDDGRSLAVVDWDDDGDLDVWLKSRTGPQLRFMRNNQSPELHYVAFRLVGKTCNRDAVGARVVVEAGVGTPGPSTTSRRQTRCSTRPVWTSAATTACGSCQTAGPCKSLSTPLARAPRNRTCWSWSKSIGRRPASIYSPSRLSARCSATGSTHSQCPPGSLAFQRPRQTDGSNPARRSTPQPARRDVGSFPSVS